MSKYINPDQLWEFACDELDNEDLTICFMYGPEPDIFDDIPKPIFSHKRGAIHYDLAQETPWVLDKFGQGRDRRHLLHAALLGRCGFYCPDIHDPTDIRYYMFFWNTEESLYDLLGDCVSELEKIIDNKGRPVVCSTPFETTNLVSFEFRDTARSITTELSPKQRELQQKMHLMRGDEKKAARQELGLYNPEKAEHPWGKSLKQKGLLIPGGKWWAPQSESYFNRNLSTLLEQPDDDTGNDNYEKLLADRVSRKPIGAWELSASKLKLGDIYDTYVIGVKWPMHKGLFILRRNNKFYDGMIKSIRRQLGQATNLNQFDVLVNYLWKLVDKQEIEYSEVRQ